MKLPCVLLCLLAGFASKTVSAAPAAGLKLATWNMEWLLTPETFRALQSHCSNNDGERRTARRQLPCDVARTLERGAADYAAMRRYAQQLDADVIAVEEVDGANAARLIFRDHDFCFTGNEALQNTGFAIRRGVPFRCEADVRGLSLGDTVRRGATVVLFPDSPRELHLMAVHLKSGCPRQPLDSRSDACNKLTRQLPALADWISLQAHARHRFAVLGDFNRDLLGEQSRRNRGSRRGVLDELNSATLPDARVHSAATRSDFRNCATGQRHSGFIDYILLSEQLNARKMPGSVERLTWSATDAARYILSDHCPVAVRIRP